MEGREERSELRDRSICVPTYQLQLLNTPVLFLKFDYSTRRIGKPLFRDSSFLPASIHNSEIRQAARLTVQ